MNEVRPHESTHNKAINLQLKIKMVVNYNTQVFHFMDTDRRPVHTNECSLSRAT
jgi:hypothetical protein